jgi:hypothetical protein
MKLYGVNELSLLGFFLLSMIKLRAVNNDNECFDSEMTLLLRWRQGEFGAKSFLPSLAYLPTYLPTCFRDYTYPIPLLTTVHCHTKDRNAGHSFNNQI